MSYNVTLFKVKRLENLRIPVAAVSSAEQGWEPECERDEKEASFFIFDECRINGHVEGSILYVTRISCHGEGSGSSMYKWIEPALKQSTGILEAICIWEGGDTINRLTCVDGVVQWDDVEL